MRERVIVLIVPGLRERDLRHMTALHDLAVDTAPLAPSFPSVSPVVQTCMLTGLLPQDHGIVSSCEFDRDSPSQPRERTTIAISAEPVWTAIQQFHPKLQCAMIGLCPFQACDQSFEAAGWPHQETNAAAPESVSHAIIHSLKSGHDLICARLAHLDQPGHEHGPDSTEFVFAREQLGRDLSDLVRQAGKLAIAEGKPPPLWIVASEYVINPVNKILRPNLLLQAAGYQSSGGSNGEWTAWAMGDHQAAHIFLRGATSNTPAAEMAELFREVDGIAEVLDADTKVHRDINHPDAGDLVLVAEPDAVFAGTYGVDANMPQPMGAHGAPTETLAERGVILASEPGVLLGGAAMADFDVAGLVLRQFGI